MRQRVSAIAHSSSAMWGPISEELIEELVELGAAQGLSPASRILDLGCGPAELLRRLALRTGARGIGVDASPFAVEEARRRIGAAPVTGVELQLGDVHDLPRDHGFDLVVCIGPGWEHGTWTDLAAWAAGFARPGGRLLLADGAWRRSPTARELAELAMSPDAYPPARDVRRLVRRGGVAPLWTRRVSPADWDAYGARYRRAMLAHLSDHPDDDVASVLRDRTGPGWAAFDLLHRLLDFVIVLGRPREPELPE